ncbi:MAG: hypothetical protein M3P37_14100 [Actinomycetota bacterium]|nr:hypothetical protein [Actinomycetota bacterium]
MRGSVVKKGDRYFVKIELDRDHATGRRQQKLSDQAGGRAGSGQPAVEARPG